jgi:hypothetical protein
MFKTKKVKELEEKIDFLYELLDSKNNIEKRQDTLISELKEKNKILTDNEVILLKNAEELRSKNRDLENNIEFLYNNLSKQKRKLIRPESN